MHTHIICTLTHMFTHTHTYVSTQTNMHKYYIPMNILMHIHEYTYIHVYNTCGKQYTNMYVHVCAYLGTYYICTYAHTYIRIIHVCTYILKVTIPQSVVLTYNSSSGTDGSHIIEHEILQNSEIHKCSTYLLTILKLIGLSDTGGKHRNNALRLLQQNTL